MRKPALKTNKSRCPISFTGKYEMAILRDQRIILPMNIIRQLKDHGIEKLLPGRLPGYKAIVLCPEAFWSKWLHQLKRNFPCLKSHIGARTYLVPWQPISWDSKGRISLPRRARDYAGIKPDQTAIILGNNYYFELWSEEKFNEITRECEDILQRSSPYVQSVGKDAAPKQG